MAEASLLDTRGAGTNVLCDRLISKVEMVSPEILVQPKVGGDFTTSGVALLSCGIGQKGSSEWLDGGHYLTWVPDPGNTYLASTPASNFASFTTFDGVYMKSWGRGVSIGDTFGTTSNPNPQNDRLVVRGPDITTQVAPGIGATIVLGPSLSADGADNSYCARLSVETDHSQDFRGNLVVYGNSMNQNDPKVVARFEGLTQDVKCARLVGGAGFTVDNAIFGNDPTLGVATLVAGTATITTQAIDPLSSVFVSRYALNGTPALGHLVIENQTANTFVVNSYDATGALANTDVSSFVWWIIDPDWS